MGWDGVRVDDIDGVPLGVAIDDIDGMPCEYTIWRKHISQPQVHSFLLVFICTTKVSPIIRLIHPHMGCCQLSVH